MDNYIKYRGIDAVFNTSFSRDAYELLKKEGLEYVFIVAQKLLKDNDIDLRCCGAEVLMRIDALKGLPLILPLLKDINPNVRSFICGIIHDIGDSRALDEIIYVLTHDKDGTVRHHAAFALGSIGTMEIIPVLKDIADLETFTDWEGRSVKDQIYDTIDNIYQRHS
jgi:HEAT repeat protein